jgi:murein DD-endopeptidase MepM/ murein hydrolase activator NlpD
MFFSKYYYNPKTCRYERVNLKWSDVIGYVFGIVATAAVFFAAIVFIQNKVINTDAEKALRTENKLLAKHHEQVKAQLFDIEQILNQLNSKDQALSQKLFDTKGNNQPENSLVQKSDVLFADADGFLHIVESLKTKSSELAETSARTNEYFGSAIELSSQNLELLRAMPSRSPLDNEHHMQLASGFGTRINPFHKGLHDHPGVDLVAPRGTTVHATGSGTVVRVNKSYVEAGYGNYIDIDHGHGFVTRYAHLEETSVRLGQKVNKGSAIGTVGNSGGSIAPHIHYEIIRDGDNVDPIHFMIEGINSAEHRAMSVLAKKQNQSLD